MANAMYSGQMMTETHETYRVISLHTPASIGLAILHFTQG